GTQSLFALGNGYHGCWQSAHYAGVAQRWMLVRSEQASHREQQTLAKNLLKESTRELKAFAKLCARRFACQADAHAELSRFTASLMLLQLDAEVVSDPVYAGCGRPKKGEAPVSYQFHINGVAATSLTRVEEARNQ
ncbi:IS1634 family transposase, partial [Aeromonas veronii]